MPVWYPMKPAHHCCWQAALVSMHLFSILYIFGFIEWFLLSVFNWLKVTLPGTYTLLSLCIKLAAYFMSHDQFLLPFCNFCLQNFPLQTRHLVNSNISVMQVCFSVYDKKQNMNHRNRGNCGKFCNTVCRKCQKNVPSYQS